MAMPPARATPATAAPPRTVRTPTEIRAVQIRRTATATPAIRMAAAIRLRMIRPPTPVGVPALARNPRQLRRTLTALALPWAAMARQQRLLMARQDLKRAAARAAWTGRAQTQRARL